VGFKILADRFHDRATIFSEGIAAERVSAPGPQRIAHDPQASGQPVGAFIGVLI